MNGKRQTPQPDPLRQVRILKRLTQLAVYPALGGYVIAFRFLLDMSGPQLLGTFLSGVIIATYAIEGAFWQMFRLRKQSAYPNIVAVRLGAERDLQQACRLACRLVADWLGARAAVLAWIDDRGRAFPACAYGLSRDALGGEPLALSAAPYYPAVADGRAVVLNRRDCPPWSSLFDHPAWLAVIPLTALDRLTGVLFVLADRRSGDLADRKLLESIGVVTGLTLENLRLSIREYESIMQVLCSALDMRDSAIEGHSRRVARMAGLIAQQMGLPRSEVKRVEQAAALHDIGKIGIADAILTKPGPLTEAEWEEMRRHPRLGYEIVAGIEALRHAAEIIYSHHERYDGGGYPRGLRGEEIPIGARIFAVVDCYDAMTSHRPYRPARSHQDAVEEILRNSGTQFDPAMVRAFLEVERAGLIAPHDLYEGDESPLPESTAPAVNAGRPAGAAAEADTALPGC